MKEKAKENRLEKRLWRSLRACFRRSPRRSTVHITAAAGHADEEEAEGESASAKIDLKIFPDDHSVATIREEKDGHADSPPFMSMKNNNNNTNISLEDQWPDSQVLSSYSSLEADESTVMRVLF